MCGLFGFIAHDKKKLDLETFIHLGITNDSRGGDSVGLFIDKLSEYGIDKNKLFSSFYKESKLLNQVSNVHIAVGHTRKASVGTVGLETAQPVVIRNKDTKEVDFVLLHNGTISNYIDLKKYLINLPDHVTDSQTMAYCLYYKGFKMYKEYEGVGMFITIDYRTDRNHPIVSFFKGGSKENNWSKTIEEERPLWVLNTEKGMWFSSIASPLTIKSFGTDNTVEQLPVNVVYSFQNGVLINEEEIDRSEKVQKKFVSSSNFYNNNQYDYSDYSNYDEYSFNRIATPIYSKNNTPIIKIINEFPSTSLVNNTSLKKVEFINGLYYQSGELLSDVLILNEWGFAPATIVPSVHFNYYFLFGVLLYGKNIYEALKQFQKIYSLSDETMITEYAHLIYNYAHSLKYDKQTKECEIGKDFDLVTYNGKYFPLFSSTYPHEYTIEGGKIKSYEEQNFLAVGKAAKTYKDKCDECNTISVDNYLQLLITNI